MAGITIVNNSKHEVVVKVAKDDDKGSLGWYTLGANGGKDTWSRDHNQVIYFVRSVSPGALVETILGVVGATATIP